jgi:hypothetical protein
LEVLESLKLEILAVLPVNIKKCMTCPIQNGAGI